MRGYKLLVVLLIATGCAEAGPEGFTPGPTDDASLPRPDTTETQPDADLPDSTKPPLDMSQPDASLPDATLPDATIPDATVPDATIPDATLPDASTQCGWINLLTSGNFDGANASWTEIGGGYDIIYGSDQVSSIDAASAPNLAWMGGVDNAKKADNTQHELHQTFTIPANATQARLRGKVCFETSESIFQFSAVDTLVTTLQSTSGAVLETIASDSNLGADYAPCAWSDFTLDLDSAHAGQTVRLHFLTETDGSAVTSFYLDDMAFEANVPCP